MTGADIVIAVLLSLAVNECWDLSPWLAHKLVCWSAYRRYTDRDRAATRAEELAAYIDERPGKLFKLLSALGFAGVAVVVAVSRKLAKGSRPGVSSIIRGLILGPILVVVAEMVGVLVVGLVGELVGELVAMLVAMLVIMLFVRPVRGLSGGLGYGLVAGLGFALFVGLDMRVVFALAFALVAGLVGGLHWAFSKQT